MKKMIKLFVYVHILEGIALTGKIIYELGKFNAINQFMNNGKFIIIRDTSKK